MTHAFYMKKALDQARQALKEGEVPVGAVLVSEGKILAKAYNQVERLQDPTAHAEILAITSACAGLGAKYLPDTILYVTLEPCAMCASAISWARIPHLVYGAGDPKKGFSLYRPSLLVNLRKTEGGILGKESEEMLGAFFRGKRK